MIFVARIEYEASDLDQAEETARQLSSYASLGKDQAKVVSLEYREETPLDQINFTIKT